MGPEDRVELHKIARAAGIEPKSPETKKQETLPKKDDGQNTPPTLIG